MNKFLRLCSTHPVSDSGNSKLNGTRNKCLSFSSFSVQNRCTRQSSGILSKDESESCSLYPKYNHLLRSAATQMDEAMPQCPRALRSASSSLSTHFQLASFSPLKQHASFSEDLSLPEKTGFLFSARFLDIHWCPLLRFAWRSQEFRY